jgi:putative ABC transport system permease protein
LGVLLVLIAAAAAAAGLMATMNARTRDLALLRALGGGRSAIALVAFAEAIMIAIAALLLGFALSWTLIGIAGHLLMERTGLLLNPQIDLASVGYLVLGAFAVAIVAALFPAIRAASTQIEELLQS